MKLYETAMLVLQMIASGEVTTMALFTAYINDELGYEIFCGDLPRDLFHMLQARIKYSRDLRDALKDSGILQQGAEIYVEKAFEDCSMLYHFMDGASTILNDPILADTLSDDDRNMLAGMLKRWLDGTINEENWETILTEMCTERASK